MGTLHNLELGRAKQLAQYKSERREWDAIRLRLGGASLIEIAERLGFGGQNRKRVRTALRSVDMPEGKRFICDRGEPFTRNTAVLFYRSLGLTPGEFAERVSTPGHSVTARRIQIWHSALWKHLTPVEVGQCVALREKIAAKLLAHDARGLGFDSYSRLEVLAALFPNYRSEYQMLRRAVKPLREFFAANADAGEPELAAFIISRAQAEKKSNSASRDFRELIRWPELLPLIVAQRADIAGEMVFNQVAVQLLTATLPTGVEVLRHALEGKVRATLRERMRELLRAHLPLPVAQPKPKAPSKARGVGKDTPRILQFMAAWMFLKKDTCELAKTLYPEKSKDPAEAAMRSMRNYHGPKLQELQKQMNEQTASAIIEAGL